jgi:peroxiredoxin
MRVGDAVSDFELPDQAGDMHPPGPLPNRRTAFVIETRAMVPAVTKSEFCMSNHVEAALAALRRRGAEMGS